MNMGDISGRPKAPPTQVVYVPEYIYQTPPAEGGASGETPKTPTACLRFIG
jgi:hypothetical protein